MTLGQRLLLAIAAVTIAITGLSGTAVREAWRSAEEQRFGEEFRAALEPLSRELGSELGEIGPLVEPVCKHDPILDTALVGLSSGKLEDYRLSISLRLPELAKALNLDELMLVTARGDVLGAHAEGIVGQRRPELAIPAALDDAVMTCLKKRAAERPASARELERMLAAVPSEGLVLEYPPELARRGGAVAPKGRM